MVDASVSGLHEEVCQVERTAVPDPPVTQNKESGVMIAVTDVTKPLWKTLFVFV
jgi:hypothetical protein